MYVCSIKEIEIMLCNNYFFSTQKKGKRGKPTLFEKIVWAFFIAKNQLYFKEFFNY